MDKYTILYLIIVFGILLYFISVFIVRIINKKNGLRSELLQQLNLKKTKEVRASKLSEALKDETNWVDEFSGIYRKKKIVIKDQILYSNTLLTAAMSGGPRRVTLIFVDGEQIWPKYSTAFKSAYNNDPTGEIFGITNKKIKPLIDDYINNGFIDYKKYYPNKLNLKIFIFIVFMVFFILFLSFFFSFIGNNFLK
ncbi:MAG: hypothetical protein AAB358_03470 [Patescibacteria group bacterium]